MSVYIYRGFPGKRRLFPLAPLLWGSRLKEKEKREEETPLSSLGRWGEEGGGERWANRMIGTSLLSRREEREGRKNTSDATHLAHVFEWKAQSFAKRDS